MLTQTGLDLLYVEGAWRGFDTCSDLCSGVAIPIRAGRALASGKGNGRIEGVIFGLELYGISAVRQMKCPQKFDVFNFQLPRRKEARTAAEGGFNVAGARKDNVVLDTVVFEPWIQI